MDSFEVRGMCHDRAREMLLALALLQEKVTAASTLEGDLAAPGLPETLFGAAVRLNLGHGDGEV